MASSLRTNIEIGVKKVGDMLVFDELKGDLTALNSKVNKGRKSWQQYNSTMQTVPSAASQANSQIITLTASMSNLVKASAGIAAFSAGQGYVRLTEDLIKYNAEMQVSSQHLNVNAQELQVWEKTAQNFNLTGEQMRDILKDVSDKIGDFANGETGEAANIIEKLGLDINELINLNPIEILKLINEELTTTANISPHEKIFLMEALANDASKLLPMLKDNNAALVEIQATMERRGTLITAEESALLLASNNQLKDMQSAVKGLTQKLGLAGAEFMVVFGPNISASIDYISANLDDIADAAEILAVVIAAKLTGSLVANIAATTRAAIAAANFGATATAGYTSAATAAGKLTVANNALAASNARVAATSSRTIGTISSLGSSATSSYASVTRATGVMATASRVGAVAVRGLGLAMGVLGGPLGVALMAAYGIYEYVSANSQAEQSAYGSAFAVDTSGASFASAGEAASWAEGQVDLYNQTSVSGIDAAINSTQNHLLEAESYREVAQAAYEAAIAKAAADNLKVARSPTGQVYGGQSAMTAIAARSEEEAEKLKQAANKAEGSVLRLRSALEKLQERQVTLGKSTAKLGKRFTASGKKATGAAKASRGLSDTQKAAKKTADEAKRAQEQLTTAFNSEKQSLIARTKELTEGAEAAYIYTKQNQDFTEVMIAELVAIKRNNKALEETKKNKEEVQKYYDNEIKSLDDQISKLKLSEREYYANTEAIKKLEPALQAEILARYDTVKAIEKQKEADKKRIEEAKKTAEEIAGIGDDLALSIAEKLIGGTESWDNIIKSWWGDIKSYFAKNILQPIIQPFTQAVTAPFLGNFTSSGSGGTLPAQGGIGGMASAGGFFGKKGALFGKDGLIFGKSIGKGISSFASKFGTTAGKTFSSAANMSNLKLGGIGIAASFLGDKMFGGYGGAGAGGASMLAAAAGLGPIGIIGAGLAGGLFGGLFGHETNYDARGLGLGLSNDGQVGLQTWQDKSQDRGWVGGTKRWTDWETELDADQEKIRSALQQQYDDSVAAMTEAAEYFGYTSAESVVTGLQSGLEVVDPSVEGFAESVVATQASDMQSGLISGLSEFQNVDIGADQAEQGLRQVIQDYGSALSQASVEEFDRIQLTENGEQVSEEEATNRIQEWLSNTLSGIFENVVGSDFDQYAISGENLAETLSRVYTQVDGVTQMSEQLGLQFGLTGMDAIDAANSLVTTAGGMDVLSQISVGYYDLLWSEKEQKQALIDQAYENLDVLNEQNGTNITTTDSLKALIQGLDLTTAAGQSSYASLSAFIPVLQQVGGVAAQLSSLMSGVENEYNKLTMTAFDYAKSTLDASYADQIEQAELLGATTDDLNKITANYQLKQADLLKSYGKIGQEIEGIDSSVSALVPDLGTSIDAFDKQMSELKEGIESFSLTDQEKQDKQHVKSGYSDEMIAEINPLIRQYESLAHATLNISDATNTTTKSTNAATEAIDEAAEAQKRLQDAYEQDKAALESQVFALTHSAQETQKRTLSEKGYTSAMVSTLSSLENKVQALEKAKQITDSFDADVKSLEGYIFELNNSSTVVQQRTWAEKGYSDAMITTLFTLNEQTKELEKNKQIAEGFDGEIKGLKDYLYELNSTSNEVQYRAWTEKEYSKTMIENLQQLKLQISTAEQLNAANDTYINYKNQLEQQHRELTLGEKELRLYQYGIENLTDTMISDIEDLKAANDALIETQRIDTAFKGYKQSLKEQGIELRLGKQALQDYKWGVEGLSDTMISELHSLQAANDAEIAAQSLFESQLNAVGTRYQDSLDALTETYESQIDIFDTLKDAAKEIRNYINDLKYTDLSTLIPIDQLEQARAEFARLKADSNNPESAGLITQAGQQVLELSRSIYGSSAAYQTDYLLITNGLDGVADQIDSLRDPQIDLVAGQKDLLNQAKSEYLRISELYQSNLDQEAWLSIINGNLGSLPDDLQLLLEPLFKSMQAQLTELNSAIANIKVSQITGGGGAAVTKVTSTYNDFTSTTFTSTNDQGQTLVAIGGGRNTGNGLAAVQTITIPTPTIASAQETYLGTALQAPRYKSGRSDPIPYDDFPAYLHKGERVIDQQSHTAIQRYFDIDVRQQSAFKPNNNKSDNNAKLIAAIKQLTQEVKNTNYKNEKIEAELRAAKEEIKSLHHTQKSYAVIAIDQRKQNNELAKSSERSQRRKVRLRQNKQKRSA